MADYRLSSRAQADPAGIADYIIEAFGLRQARRYRDELETCFHNLAENPRIGRLAERLAPGLRLFEHKSHAVFYTEYNNGVLIVRVLHIRMDASLHL